MLTLLQMANFIVGKVGQYDTTSLTLCKAYLGARYQMVWDSYFWHDSQSVNSVDLTAGNNQFPLPVTMERVVTIGNPDGTFLDPVDESFLLEAASSLINGSGLPQHYTETPDGITVYPSPEQDITFTLYGKKPCPGFGSDTTTSLLRNCDNAIIAFAMGDMLERLRQYAKAQAKFQEAGTLLEAAKSVERDQANRPRRSKNLTVAGNSLAEMTDAVCGICGVWTPDYRILAKEFIRRNYVSLYQLQLWPESTVLVRVASVGEQIVLPNYVDRVLAARSAEGFNLMPNDLTYLFGVSPTIFEQTGTPLSMSILTPVGVAILPQVPPEGLLIASSDATDVGVRVFIRGEAGGTEVTETVVIGDPATTAVMTKYAYDVPLTVAKPLTNGDISVYSSVSGNLYQFLGADERERKHQRLMLLPVSQTTDPVDCEHGILVLGKRHIIPLRTDEDTPIITGAQGVLIAGAAADLFTRLGNADSAAKYSARADAAAKALISENTDQAAHQPKIVPVIEPYALGPIEEGYCWSKA